MKKPIFIVIGIGIVIAILINNVFTEPIFESLEDKASFAVESGQHELAKETYRQLILQDSSDIRFHRGYIDAHFNLPEREQTGRYTYEERNDDSIYNDYVSKLRRSVSAEEMDLGRYCLGYWHLNTYSFDSAIFYFHQVENRVMKYLNNSTGYCYSALGQMDSAINYYYKEIEAAGNTASAYGNLGSALLAEQRIEEFRQLVDDPATKQHLYSGDLSDFFFLTGNIFAYAKQVIRPFYSSVNLYHIIGALAILVCWTVYLYKLDFYEKEKVNAITLTLVLGAIFSIGVFFISDLFRHVFGFGLNGEMLNDFFYCVIGIGAVEELFKVIPLLIVCFYTKNINEPYDFIFYASLSALGFAFAENILYLKGYGIEIMHARALMASVGHMFFSSIIAYGLIQSVFRGKGSFYRNFLLYFGLASLAHGFYDFWLVNEAVRSFSVITLIFLLSSIFIWNSFKSNALNNSSFFNADLMIKKEKLPVYLIFSLSSIFFLEFLMVAVQYGPSAANHAMLEALYSGSFLLFFISTNVGKIKIEKGQWGIWNVDPKYYIQYYEKIVGAWISMKPLNPADEGSFLFNEGRIVLRATVSGEYDWYVVRLGQPLPGDGYLNDSIVIRTKDKKQRLKKGKTVEVVVCRLQAMNIGEDNKMDKNDLVFVGVAELTTI